MENFTEVLGYGAGVLSIASYIPYIYGVYAHGNTPSRASWFIWSIASLIILTSYSTVGAETTIWQPVAYLTGSIIIFLISIKRGVGGWTTFDKWCLSGTGLSLFLWLVLNSPLAALLTSLTIDAIGGLPTIKNAYQNPGSESKVAWSLFFSGSLCNLFSFIFGTDHSFEVAVYPIVMSLIVGAITIFVLFKKPIVKVV